MQQMQQWAADEAARRAAMTPAEREAADEEDRAAFAAWCENEERAMREDH